MRPDRSDLRPSHSLMRLLAATALVAMAAEAEVAAVQRNILHEFEALVNEMGRAAARTSAQGTQPAVGP